MSDGPLGLRSGQPATAFPAGVAMGATFDPDLIGQVGGVLAEEALSFGHNMLLGPCVNISRTPWGGRNFESYGEDPFLTSSLAASYVTAVMGHRVLSSTKHFILNDQEFERMTVNVNADTRTIFEMYMPPFEAAVDAGTGTIMASYNRVNGLYSAENGRDTQDFLETKLGFRGLLVSDWGAVHSTVESANAGLDIEMPTASFFGDPLKDAVAHGLVTQATIDAKVQRILRAMTMTDLLDSPLPSGEGPETKSHQDLAEKVAEQSLVLLKNEARILPLNEHSLKRVAVIGQNAANLITGGGGSSHVTPFRQISPLDALRARLGDKVSYAVGSDGSNAVQELQEAVQLAKSSDVALVFTGLAPNDESEGQDRASLDLPPAQAELIRQVSQVNPRTVVIFNSGSAMLLGNVLDAVPGVVQAWYPGQEGGTAIARVLLGDVSPSGKLPITWMKREEDTSSYKSYPGVNGEITYSEGVFVGYRHFDQDKIAPLFPFGYGQTYSKFELSGVQVLAHHAHANSADVEVIATLKNVGNYYAAEVVQAYVGELNPSVARPPRELKAFKKVFLKPGQKTQVRLHLGSRAFAFFDSASSDWKVNPGQFMVNVGFSSRDISSHELVVLK